MRQSGILPITFMLCTMLLAIAVEGAGASEAQSMLGYTVTPKVTYGQAAIVKDGKTVNRDLWMDVYEPFEQVQKARPALIMTFGGAFHRGDPRNSFHEGGAQDTAMGDYCKIVAKQGYVCFAIEYRLAPEHPILAMSGYTDDDIDKESFNYLLPQINLVRHGMGLNTIDPKDPKDALFLRDVILSPAEDLKKAVDHIRTSATQYNIDPDRIILGGFSAGAVTSWNVAHGMHVPVAGVFLLSGVSVGFDIAKSVTAESPPILMFLGENDLEGGLQLMPQILQHYGNAETHYEFAWVPGFGHFYPSGAKSLGADGSRMSVEARILKFLAEIVDEN